MKTVEFDYHLPLERIAQTPSDPRDHARLMVIDRKQQTINHQHFYDITKYLKKGDVLVINNSRVFKARLRGRVVLDEVSSGLTVKPPEQFDTSNEFLALPTVEIFLVRPMENQGVWKVLAKPGRKLRLGMKIVFAEDFYAEVLTKEKDGTLLMQFSDSEEQVREKANQYGEVPLPPYVKEQLLSQDQVTERYQTVCAKHEGSVAAPTAGFHFTPELMATLKQQGVEFAEVTLHVGLGTFLPVKTSTIEEHVMHSEWVELETKDADVINSAKKEGRRIIAVGTTALRALEGISQKLNSAVLKQFSGEVNIFITPGYTFRIVDALITNFHLPKSTLLMLVSVFVGDKDFVLQCYQTAIKEGYKFYSFGDAMFIY